MATLATTGMVLPPHRSIEVPGLHAYADRISVAAGDSIGFRVSSTAYYDFKICRLGPSADDPTQDEIVHVGGHFPPRVQAIHPGSYVLIAPGLDEQAATGGLSIELWLKPWGFGDPQTVMSQFDDQTGVGFELLIDKRGCIELRCMDGGSDDGIFSVSSPPIKRRQWVHVVASCSNKKLTMFINGAKVASSPGPLLRLPSSPLRVGATSVNGLAAQFLDADVVMPVIYGHELTQAEVSAGYAELGLCIPRGKGVLACWPLDEERGDQVVDASGNGRHGEIINHATWMILGPAFEPTKVPRFSPSKFPYDPAADDSRGHGLRFASDDLVDCRWDECHRVHLPDGCKPGMYVGRFDFVLNGSAIRYDVTFVVRRSPTQVSARLLVLCATNTWRAYASAPFARNVVGAAHWPRKAAPLPNSHPDAPAFNHYTPHRHGQPTYYAGLRMPWPSAAPDALYAPDGAGFSHGPRLERCLYAWLESQEYDYDVASDLDVHQEPGLLCRYDAVVVNGHSEYWSAPALNGLDSYLCSGGNLIALSGNTMYWRVSFNEDCSVMEQRKTLTPADQSEDKHAAPGGCHGEQYHSQDGMRGGLWRFNDRSCSSLIGLETAGWAFAEPKDFGVYRVSDHSHFLFHVPEETGLGAGSTFGHAPGQALPRAIGHEWDLTIPTLRQMTRGSPEDGNLPPDPVGVQVIAQGVRTVPGQFDAYLDFFERATQSIDGLSAEMIYWERPEGGRVFNAGAVGASWVLGADESFSALLRNVLHHFGIRPV